MSDWAEIRKADDVTDEILKMAQEIEEGFYGGGAPIDWGDFLDRMDGTRLADGSRLDLGDSLSSPAVKKIKRHIRSLRAQD